MEFIHYLCIKRFNRLHWDIFLKQKRNTASLFLIIHIIITIFILSSIGAAGNTSPLWHLAQVKMEPQDSEEGQVSGHGVLGSNVFEEGPMSTMSEAGIPPSPGGSEGSYMSHSPDSLIGTSPFTQRPKKRMRKV